MRNKVKWGVLTASVIVSIVFGFFQSVYDQTSPSLVSNVLSFTALPSLIISCWVLIDIKEVKENVERDLNYQNYLSGRDNDERFHFFDDYRNYFLISFSTLEKSLKTIVLNQGGDSEEFVKRVQDTAYECLQSIESYGYIESCIKVLESNMGNIDKQESERKAQNEVYKYTTSELTVLKKNLKSLYNKNEFNIKSCEDLKNELVKFKHFCDHQIKKIEGQFYLNDNKGDEKGNLIDE